ncbi:MAG: hypothetical protein MJ252_13600 [archaeon]|nr:hypothetical protein [archaeon]
MALYSVYQGTGVKLTHKASAQYSGCSNKVKYASCARGDLVFVN